jgi:heme A synthase
MHCGEWVTQPRQQSVRVTNIRQARDWISRLASFMLGLVALALLAGFAIYVFQMFKGK